MKTVDEWALAFDVLWNNIASDKAPGLEPYEKSLFLTQAENALVKDYFSSGSNVWKEGFDDSERRQSDFRTLVESASLSSIDGGPAKFITRSGTRYYQYPPNALLVLNEELVASVNDSEKFYVVVPISYEELFRLMKKPYKYPPKGQAWRLISNTGQENDDAYQVLEIIGRFPEGCTLDYRMRYVKRPSPIILEDLEEGMSIDGQTEAMTCTLPEHLHDEILQRAVMIAKIAWTDSAAAQGQTGQI